MRIIKAMRELVRHTVQGVVLRIPFVYHMKMELEAAVDYHNWYGKSIDTALGQPRYHGGPLLNEHLMEIKKLKANARFNCRDCGADDSKGLMNGLCPDCYHALCNETAPCICSGGYNPECEWIGHHNPENTRFQGTANL